MIFDFHHRLHRLYFLSFRTERSAVKNLNTSTNSPLERGRGVLECIELCILRFAHDTPPAPSLEGSSLAYCHSEELCDEESRVHPCVHPSLCSRDPSLHSVPLWMTRGGEGICTPWRNTSRCKQENVVLRPIERPFSLHYKDTKSKMEMQEK